MSDHTTLSTTKELLAIQQKLDTWELEHLREHSAALYLQVEELKEQVEQLKRELVWADDCAEMWQQTAELLQHHPQGQICITRDGHVGVRQ